MVERERRRCCMLLLSMLWEREKEWCCCACVLDACVDSLCHVHVLLPMLPRNRQEEEARRKKERRAEGEIKDFVIVNLFFKANNLKTSR